MVSENELVNEYTPEVTIREFTAEELAQEDAKREAARQEGYTTGTVEEPVII